MNAHPTTSPTQAGAQPQVRSLAFGFTRERIIGLIGFALIILFVFSQTQSAGEVTWLPWVMVAVLVLLALFNIGLTVTDTQVIIRNCGVRIYRCDIAQIQRLAKIKEASAIERWTFGLHYLGGGWAFHAGAPNLAFQLKNKKIFLVTVEDPEAIMENIKSKNSEVQLSTCATSSAAMLMGTSFARR